MSLTTVDSAHIVSATVDRLIAALGRRGISVFVRIDHAAGARKAGLELADEEVLIFGNPQAGTPLMQADPTIGFELPLRLLVWNAGGQTKIGYRPPTELADTFAVTTELETLRRMENLLQQISAESSRPDD